MSNLLREFSGRLSSAHLDLDHGFASGPDRAAELRRQCTKLAEDWSPKAARYSCPQAIQGRPGKERYGLL
ncbi:MAG: hypothetical protein WCD87_14285, partial [Pseudolabrys sp.]